MSGVRPAINVDLVYVLHTQTFSYYSCSSRAPHLLMYSIHARLHNSSLRLSRLNFLCAPHNVCSMTGPPIIHPFSVPMLAELRSLRLLVFWVMVKHMLFP